MCHCCLYGHQVCIEGSQRGTRFGRTNAYHRVLRASCHTIFRGRAICRIVASWLWLLRFFILREFHTRSSLHFALSPLVSINFLCWKWPSVSIMLQIKLYLLTLWSVSLKSSILNKYVYKAIFLCYIVLIINLKFNLQLNTTYI